MTRTVKISGELAAQLRAHFFQNDLEQAAFLFARAKSNASDLVIDVFDAYLVPPEGWIIQHEVYLELKDEERAKVMAQARKLGAAIVDCHSHPGSGADVWFSPSDRAGISDFAQYAKWKLDGRPFTALVFGEKSVDAVMWDEKFTSAHQVSVIDFGDRRMPPRGSWFQSRSGKHRFTSNEY
jgi:hypothetical protein